jgi:hypothetical protein
VRISERLSSDSQAEGMADESTVARCQEHSRRLRCSVAVVSADTARLRDGQDSSSQSTSLSIRLGLGGLAFRKVVDDGSMDPTDGARDAPAWDMTLRFPACARFCARSLANGLSLLV